MSHQRQRWHLYHFSRKTSRSAPNRPWPDSATDVTNGRADPGDDTLQVSNHDEHPPVRGKGAATVTGIGGVGPGSEPGLRRPRLGVPQSDEPVSLPPAGQQSSVRGGVKHPMCGFPSKQYLELQRRASVRAGCQGRAASHRPFAGGRRADGECVACSSPNLTAGGGHRARAGAAVTETSNGGKGRLREQAFGS